MGALELQELVIAATRTVRVLAADRGTRLVYRAAARLAVEIYAHRVEVLVLLVAQQPHPLLRVVLGEPLLCLGGAQGEVLRQALDVARRHFDLRIAAAIAGALQA